jgi:hypothetical protein
MKKEITKDFLEKHGKSIKIPITKCKKCKRILDLRITTELSPEEEKKKDPKVLILYGLCHKCEIIYMLRLIKIKDIPMFHERTIKDTLRR